MPGRLRGAVMTTARRHARGGLKPSQAQAPVAHKAYIHKAAKRWCSGGAVALATAATPWAAAPWLGARSGRALQAGGTTGGARWPSQRVHARSCASMHGLTLTNAAALCAEFRVFSSLNLFFSGGCQLKTALVDRHAG